MFMTSEQMTAEQRVQKAIVAIMQNQKYVALAGILMIGERVITDDPKIPTACTNGRDEMYNRDFVDKLNDAELRFLILHESYHKLYRHMGHLLVGVSMRSIATWTRLKCIMLARRMAKINHLKMVMVVK